MIKFVSLFGVLGTASVMFLMYTLAKLSERFGAVIKMPPIYRYFYLAAALVGVSVLTQALHLFNLTWLTWLTWLTQPWVLLVTYYLPLSIGVTLALGITWRYWRWLVKEDRRET